MKRVRSLLSLAASAVAVVALAVPAQAVGTGTYVIRDLRGSGCLTPLGSGGLSPVVLKYDGACTRWKVTNQEDGDVQISPADQPGCCLDIVPFPQAAVVPCGEGTFQHWRIADFGPGSPARIRNLDTGGCLTARNPEGPVVALSCDESAYWRLEPAL